MEGQAWEVGRGVLVTWRAVAWAAEGLRVGQGGVSAWSPAHPREAGPWVQLINEPGLGACVRQGLGGHRSLLATWEAVILAS